MTQLQWHDTPEKAHAPTGKTSAVNASDPWFVATMGLLGFIIGYIIGNV